MADKIIDVLNISAASGWYFDNALANQMSDFTPVACFALVLTRDPDYPALAHDKLIIPICPDELGLSVIGAIIGPTTVISEADAKLRVS